MTTTTNKNGANGKHTTASKPAPASAQPTNTVENLLTGIGQRLDKMATAFNTLSAQVSHIDTRTVAGEKQLADLKTVVGGIVAEVKAIKEIARLPENGLDTSILSKFDDLDKRLDALAADVNLVYERATEARDAASAKSSSDTTRRSGNANSNRKPCPIHEGKNLFRNKDGSYSHKTEDERFPSGFCRGRLPSDAQ